MPKGVAKEIVNMQRKFLWGGTNEGRPMPLVNWKLVQQRKDRGGLGVGDIEFKNDALLLKWWWRYATEDNVMWKKVIKSVHSEGQALLPLCPQRKVQGQGIWNSLKRMMQDHQLIAPQLFRQNLKLVLGNGQRVRFWEDQWINNGPLMQLYSDLYKLSSQKYATINNMGWFEGSLWKWTLAWKRELRQNEIQQLDEMKAILSQYCPKHGQEDNLLWKGNATYSVKELQKHVNVEIEVDSLVSTVWKKLAPPKVEFFMWLALLGRLNTKQRLYAKGLLQEDQITCQLCSLQPESLDHILLLCPYSQNVWTVLAAELGHALTIAVSFREHYEKWMDKPWRRELSKKIWRATFFAIAWNIWMTRNEVVFQSKVFNHEDICRSIKRQVAFWTKAWKEELPCSVDEYARNVDIMPAIL